MIALLGSTGYIGSAFKEEIKRRNLDFISMPGQDALDFRRVQLWLASYQPDLLINAAAFVTKPSVDLCEDHKEETLIGNMAMPLTVAHACNITNTPLLHISTGCLFNGDNRGFGFNEKAAPHLRFDNGSGFYVGSKHLAERLLQEMPRVYICRIRIPFDQYDNERNYLSKLQRYPKVYNGRNSLAHRGDFVKACLDLWKVQAPFGTYNVTNVGQVSAKEICIMIRRILKIDRPFLYWDEQEFMTTVARTPKSNCMLNCEKLLKAGVKIRTVHEAVEDSLRNWVPEKTSQEAVA